MPYKIESSRLSASVRILPALIVLLAVMNSVYAQRKTESFAITIPENKIANSLYNRVNLVDIRPDTNDYGIVQKGAFNRKERVVPDLPFSVQFSNVVNAFTDSTASDGELVLLLRQLRFAEITGAMSEKGYFHFRAELYSKVQDKYQPVAGIDTVVVVSSMDVTKPLFRAGNKNLLEFIQQNLAKKPAPDITYSLYDIRKIDSLEKSKLPLYQARQYKNGAYKTFSSFVNQQPDEEDIKMEYSKDGPLEKVLMKNSKGKYSEVRSGQWYAFCYDNYLYVSNKYGIYPLEHRDHDFYFTGKAEVQPRTGDVVAAGVFFGLIGTLIASSGSADYFAMKIDHKSGGFIRVDTPGN